MINNYEIKNIDNEKVLVLYLDFSYEFGSFTSKNKDLFLSTVKNYIDKLDLKENFQKILLVSGSIVAATLLYTTNDVQWLSGLSNKHVNDINSSIDISESDNSNLPSENIELGINKEEHSTPEEVIDSKEESGVNKEENSVLLSTNKEDQKKPELSKPVSNNINKQPVKENTPNSIVEETKNLVTIHRSNGTVIEIELEEYLVGVLAAEMPASFSSEALKAQAVVARTYTLKKISRGGKLTDTVSTQAYIDIDGMKTKWGSDFLKYYNKIKEAVSSTKGEYITYNGDYINAVYHSTSNGYTEDAVNVWKESYPYLKSVESSWDKNTSSYERTIDKELQNLLDITGLSNDNIEIKILSRNNSGRVELIQVGGKTYTGIEFRNLLGLRSTDFDINVTNNNIEITTRGYGHGVGMSQYGANEMSKLGYNYKQIINHYYTGVKIQK